MEIVRIDAQRPGQCPVAFCVANEDEAPTFHGKTWHVDATGQDFRSCVHGNLSHWNPCDQCGYGTDDYPDRFGDLLNRLTREWRRTDLERRIWAKQPEQEMRNQIEYAAVKLEALRMAIGAAVNARLGRDVDLTSAELSVIGGTYLDSIPKAER